MADVSVRVERARVYRALGDERRLQIADALQLSDRAVGDLAEMIGLPTNLLAFHLKVLEDADVIARRRSRGDARRRYVSLNPSVLSLLGDPPSLEGPAGRVLFVCTANSARSQLAAGLWRDRTGRAALSAGTQPAARVHPTAVDVAHRHGLDLTGARPVGYADVDVSPDLVVSVCDRAHEQAPNFGAPLLHWSVPDPVPEGAAAFEDVFEELRARIDRLACAA